MSSALAMLIDCGIPVVLLAPRSLIAMMQALAQVFR
jgi:hypothetical protein